MSRASILPYFGLNSRIISTEDSGPYKTPDSRQNLIGKDTIFKRVLYGLLPIISQIKCSSRLKYMVNPVESMVMNLLLQSYVVKQVTCPNAILWNSVPFYHLL